MFYRTALIINSIIYPYARLELIMYNIYTPTCNTDSTIFNTKVCGFLKLSVPLQD